MGNMDAKKTLPCTDCGKPLEVSSRASSVTCGSCVDAWYSNPVDVTTLCVGDKVLMGSGCYCAEGHVIRVGPLGVDVTDNVELFQFGKDNIERNGKRTFECGPWMLVRKLA